MLAVFVTGVFAGSSACTVAVFAIVPLSTSAWVTVYVAVQLIVALGARVAGATGVQPMAERPGIGSVTATLCRVTVPVFVTPKV